MSYKESFIDLIKAPSFGTKSTEKEDKSAILYIFSVFM